MTNTHCEKNRNIALLGVVYRWILELGGNCNSTILFLPICNWVLGRVSIGFKN